MDNDTIKKNQTAEKTSLRREALGSGAAAAASMMLGALIAACGGSSSKSGGEDGGPAEDSGATAADSGANGEPDAGSEADASVAVDHDIQGLNALLTAEYSAITA